MVGCGAVGGVIAAHLIERGHDVTLTTTNASVARQVAREGLRVRTPQRRFQVQATTTAAPAPQRRFRYILLATQGDRAVEAARTALPALAEGGHMVVLQNGLCEERVADVVGADRVIGAVVGWGATKLGDGGVTVGRLQGGPTGALTDLTEPLSSVGPVKPTENLRGARWSKLALNCAVSGLGTV